ncbi:MAG: HAD family hydrolase [Pyrinomonadaceae bacterium]
MIKAILFDFNGIIIDDEELQKKAYQEVLQAEGIALTDEDYYASLGMDDESFVRAAYARTQHHLSDEKMRLVIERETAAHRKLIEKDVPLFPGAVTFVKACARHFTIGLVSMSRRTQIDYVLERIGLESAFDVIVSAEDVTACKPDPMCYKRGFQLADAARHSRKMYSLVQEDCLAIEDAPPGILAARAAGLRTLGVTNTVSANELRAAGADVVTANLADWTIDAVQHVFEFTKQTANA